MRSEGKCTRLLIGENADSLTMDDKSTRTIKSRGLYVRGEKSRVQNRSSGNLIERMEMWKTGLFALEMKCSPIDKFLSSFQLIHGNKIIENRTFIRVSYLIYRSSFQDGVRIARTVNYEPVCWKSFQMDLWHQRYVRIIKFFLLKK